MSIAQQQSTVQESGTESVTVFEAMAAVLTDAGVEEVFGLMGDDTARLVSALVNRGIPYRNARHENAAIAMATGYASATGRLGVCVISRGPGTTNGLTGGVNASRGDASVLIITGDGSVERGANTIKLPDSKAIDATVLATGCGLPMFTPRNADSVRASVREAIGSALGGRTVLLTVPVDVFEDTVRAADNVPSTDTVANTAPIPGRAQAIASAAAVLSQTSRPLIIAGAGAWTSGAREALMDLADRVGGVLATTLRGKDMFHGHPYNVGMIGSFSHSAGRRIIEQADCVLTFGASLNRQTTNDGMSLPQAPVIHIDTERDNIGRYHWADVSVVGDARLVAEQLLEVLPARSDIEKPWHTEDTRRLLADFKLTDDFEPASERWTLDPRTLILELDKLLPDDRAVVTDNGNFFGFVPPHISVPTPDRFKLSSDFAVIGLGLGTALGTALARPGVPTVLFVGDGALLMSLGELETLARLDTPLIVVVMNDCAYGAERHFLELRRHSARITMFPDSDFAAVAEAFGIESATVRSVEDLRALAPALEQRDGPLLLDCKVTPSVVAPFLSDRAN